METILYDFAGEDMVGWYLVLGIWLQAHGCVAIPRTAPASQTKPNTNYQLPNTGTWYLAASPRLHFQSRSLDSPDKANLTILLPSPHRPGLPDKAKYQIPTTKYQIPVLGIWLQAHGCVAIPAPPRPPRQSQIPTTNYQIPVLGIWLQARGCISIPEPGFPRQS